MKDPCPSLAPASVLCLVKYPFLLALFLLLVVSPAFSPMVSFSELASLLDFGHGLDFEESMFNQFGKRVNGNSFILLVTFRRYVF